MSAKDAGRIVELQRQVKIARDALNRIADGCDGAESVAYEALYEMMPLDAKRQLQGLVGHEGKRR